MLLYLPVIHKGSLMNFGVIASTESLRNKEAIDYADIFHRQKRNKIHSRLTKKVSI